MATHDERGERWFPAFDPRFNFPVAPPVTAIDDEPTTCLIINERWFSHLDGAIERLLWEDAWGGSAVDKERATNEVLRLLRSRDGSCAVVGETVVIDNRTCVIVDNEDYEQMSRLSILKEGSFTYLLEDCGCGQYNRYLLSPVSPEEPIGAQPDNDGGGFPSNALAVSAPYVNCYNEKAASIATARAKAWFSRMIDLVNIGVDLTTADEVVEIAGEAIDLLLNNNQWEDIRSTTKTAFESSIDGFVSAWATNWPEEAPITRRSLKASIDEAFPFLDGAVPIKAILYRWATYANIRALNASLAIASTECQSGSNLPEPGSVVETVGNYRARLVVAEPLVASDTTWIITGVGLAAFGLTIISRTTGSGIGTLYVVEAEVDGGSGQSFANVPQQIASVGSGQAQFTQRHRVGWGAEDVIWDTFSNPVIKNLSNQFASQNSDFTSTPQFNPYELTVSMDVRLTGWDLELLGIVVLEHVP